MMYPMTGQMIRRTSFVPILAKAGVSLETLALAELENEVHRWVTEIELCAVRDNISTNIMSALHLHISTCTRLGAPKGSSSKFKSLIDILSLAVQEYRTLRNNIGLLEWHGADMCLCKFIVSELVHGKLSLTIDAVKGAYVLYMYHNAIDSPNHTIKKEFAIDETPWIPLAEILRGHEIKSLNIKDHSDAALVVNKYALIRKFIMNGDIYGS